MNCVRILPVSLLRAAAVACVSVLAACSGDTLYDTGTGPDVPGPTTTILDPGTGQEAQVGRQVRVTVLAEDSLGVSEIEITYRGVLTGVITRTFTPPLTVVVFDTVIQLPTTVGQLEIVATARNGLGGVGQSAPAILSVVPTDETPPFVEYTSFTPARMELTDEIRVSVTGGDNSGGSGLARLGLTVLVRTDDRPDTLVFQQSETYSPARAEPATEEFAFPPPFTSMQDLPRTLILDIYAFAVDSAGNCTATSGTGQLPCASLVPGQSEPIIAAGEASNDTTIVVTGRSVALPPGTIVPDAAVDFARQRLYLSSLTQSRVEILDLNTLTFSGSGVRVGSEPWGLSLNRTSDTLIVANSGGTNISYVPIAAANPTEDVLKRIRTPNNSVFIVDLREEEDRIVLAATFIDFSDRPQFIAQDYLGRLLYSTRPTPASPDGTLRIATNQSGWQQPEVRLLFSELVTQPDTTKYTIANIDSLRVFISPGADDLIELYDHRDGFPNQIVRSGIRPLFAAIDSLEADPNSDIIWRAGVLDLEVTGLRDTTYVSASGDRRRIAFGEGATPAGRIIMWNAPTASISNEISIRDIVGNASERVTGIALNTDGTLNVARGTAGAYFFKEDLRLQGFSNAPTPPLLPGSGAQLHPQHPSYNVFPPSGPNTLGFVASGDVIRIVDTVHFSSRGEIPVRDPITGPLRVSPSPSGAGCPGPDCVVARLYGVTNAGTVVIVDVRSRDILPL